MNVGAALERVFAGRWIAGYYTEDALDKTRQFNSKGVSTLINFLGEDLTKSERINETVSTYLEVIKEIKRQKLDSSISLKPTQIGLKVSFNLMRENYLKIARIAKENGIFVWLDMESPESIDNTIKAYKPAVKYGNVGICIQAYLKRSASDVEELVKYGAKIRLVKGAYQIKEDGGFGSEREINHNYAELMKELLDKSNDIMIATHDSRIIEETIRLNKKKRKRVTYAMLNGIRNKYAKYLARHSYSVAIYVPFGRDWLTYGYRRLLEQKHITLILRSLFETQNI